MITVHTDDHRLRAAKTELSGGLLLPPFECPERVDMILSRIAEVNLGPVEPPTPHGLDPLARVHDADYLDFLSRAWDDWVADGHTGEAIPLVWPARRMRNRPPNAIDGRIGYYAMAAETSISGGTWEAARAAADVALTATDRVRSGPGAAFALCRPPGHHAARDMFGGYCFLNNAAIAAQSLIDAGAGRVAILDVDFHHGNGTQDIFYDRGDVLFASIHGAPEEAFPHFLGFADETGTGDGEGATLNLPLPPGTGWDHWSEALETACRTIADFAPDALVISLGADTYEGDPISFFRLTSDDFTPMGTRLADLRLPTVIVMEGGYAVDALGLNTVNFLQGFDAAS